MTIKLVTLHLPYGQMEIHIARCGHIEKKMKICDHIEVETVEATNLDEIAQHYADAWKQDTDEDIPANLFKDQLLRELKPCTGLRK